MLATDADGDTLTYSLTTAPTDMTIGSLSGLISWTPTAAQVGNQTVTVQVNDGKGGTDSQNYQIVVNAVPPIHHSPVFTSTPVTTARVNQPYGYDANATDLDAGDTLTFSLTTAPSGMTIDAVTGVISWRPTAVQTGAHPVAVRVVDQTGLADTQNFSLTVINSVLSNAVPVITTSPATAISQGQNYRYDIDATDVDGDPLSYALISAPPGMSIDPASGQIGWTPAQPGGFPVVVGVSDGRGGQTSQSYVLNVQEVNAAPRIASSAPLTATRGLLYRYPVEATDPNGDELVFSLVKAPEEMTIDRATGMITWTPSSAQTGQNPVTVQVADPAGLADAQSFTVTVAVNPNHAPVAAAGRDRTVPPGIQVTLEGSGSSDPDGDPLAYRWQWVARPEGSAAVLVNPTSVSPSFQADATGKYTLQLVVSDGQLDSAPDTVTIEVTVLLAAGTFHTCALNYGGAAQCWGSNQVGQLGIGTFGPPGTGQAGPVGIPSPATVMTEDNEPLIGIIGISSGARDHTCALTTVGGVKCWGWNFNGTLGDGTTTNRATAVDVRVAPGGAPLTGITALETGGDHTCAITTTGGVKCWGWGSHGQLGNDQGVLGSLGLQSSIPVDVLVKLGGEPLRGATAVAAGGMHTCALMKDATVKCWGNNDWGQLGNGASLTPGQSNDRIFSPVDVVVASGGLPLTGAVAITAGAAHSCALMNDSGVKCWGRNFVGELGDGTGGQGATDPAQGAISTTPVDVLTEPGGARLTGAIAIAAGEDHTCALMANSTVKCWGTNDGVGKLGNGEQFSIWITPVDVLAAPGEAPLTGVTTMALGLKHTCAALSGGVKCWGQNTFGQLGNGEVGMAGPGGVNLVSDPDPRLTPADALLGLDPVLVAIAIAPTDSSLAPGATRQFTAKGILSNGRTQDLTASATWESSNPAVATVNAAGLVTATSVGITTIRVTKEGISRSASLVVATGVLRAIEISPSSGIVLFDRDRYDPACIAGASSAPDCDELLLPQALTEQAFTATGVYSDGTRLDLTQVATWASSATIVGIGPDGVAVGMGLGSAIISASRDGVQGAASVTVYEEIVGDNTPPTVALSPPDNTPLLAPTDILATVTDDHLLKYELRISPPGESESRLIAVGTSAVNEVVTTIDPSSPLLVNGLYTLRLTAVDRSGNTTTETRVYPVQDEAKVGLFRLAFRDLAVPVSGIPIEIIRTYDSRVKSQEDFGVGWTLEVRRGSVKSNRPPGEGWQILQGGGVLGLPCQSVDETAFHTTEVRLSDLEYYRFGLTLARPAAITGGCTAEAGFKFLDGSTPGATLEILDGKDVLYENGTNQVVKPGTEEVFDPKQVRLTTVDGRVIEFDREAGGVTRIQDRNGNALTITRAGITHTSGKNIVFTRDTLGRITEIADPKGNTLKYAYDAQSDLTAFTDQAANRTTFRYDGRHYLTDIFDPLGNRAIRSEYDADGRLIATVDAQGNRMAMTHDQQNRREAITDRLGRITVHEYDEQGNILTTIDALGQRTTYTYDAGGNTLTVTDPLGHVTTSTYDGSNNLLTETDPLGHVTTYTYTGRNEPLTITDAAGHVTTYIYPITSGNLEGITDPLGHTTSLGYDRVGNLASLTDPLGHANSFEYDGAGNRIKQTDPLGHVTTHTFDANGNELTATTTWTDAAGKPVTLVTRKEYDALNRLIRTTDPLDHVTRTEYNAAGQVTAQIDAKGRRTEFDYDTLGQRTRTRYPDGAQETVAYDAEGNEVQTTDRAGRTTSFVYDALDRLTQTTYPDGGSTRTVYDAAGREIASLDEKGNEIGYGYDAAGNRLSAVDALGNETRYAYDVTGRQTGITDANGRVTGFDYDAAGRRTKTRLPNGAETALGYDAAGRLTQKTDPAGKTTTYEYDAQGRLTAVIDALGQRTSYSYDEQGKLLTQTDANGHITRYEYDALGQRTATVLPLGQRSTSVYDVVGNLISSTDFNSATTTYGYDASDRLGSKQLPDGPAVNFTYTASGQRETATDGRGVTRYAYDARDRLLSRTDPDGALIRYTYDSVGNVNSITTLAGAVAYTFDARNQMATVTAPDGSVTRYAYDAVGNLIRTDLPNGTAETRTYDELNRLTLIESRNTATGQIMTRFAYALDSAGNRTSVTEHDGRRVEYAYDALDRLTQERIFNPGATQASRTLGYVYDPVGNRLRRDDSMEGVTTYAYDDNDRLLTETMGAATTTYGYDHNGNTISKTGAGPAVTYGWNAENRLIGADTDGNGAQDLAYQYDADGIRVTKTVSGAETRFLIDANRPYAQVLEERTPAGASTASYVYGNALIAQNHTGQASYYHADGLGSTRALSNAAGTATDRYAYEAYGRTIARSGATNNLYLFAGEQRDSDVGLDYLRARYLVPGLGRFNTRDVYEVGLWWPMARHPYAYGDDNVPNRVDPSGMFSLAVLAAGMISDIRTHLSLAQIRAGRKSILMISDLLPEVIRIQELGLHGIAEGTPGAEDLYDYGRDQFLAVLSSIPRAFKKEYETAARELASVVRVTVHVTGGSNGFLGVGGLRNVRNVADFLQKVKRYASLFARWAEDVENLANVLDYKDTRLYAKAVQQSGKEVVAVFAEICPFVELKLGPVSFRYGGQTVRPQSSSSDEKISFKLPLGVYRKSLYKN